MFVSCIFYQSAYPLYIHSEHSLYQCFKGWLNINLVFSLVNNGNLVETGLSDFIFLQQIIASHIIKIHASADANQGDNRVAKEENWLKRFARCR